MNARLTAIVLVCGMAAATGCNRQGEVAKPTPEELDKLRDQYNQSMALGRIVPTPQMTTALKPAPEPNLKQLAVDALGGIGEAGVPSLIGALSHPEAVVRAEAAAALGRLGAVAGPAVPALIGRVNDPDASVRKAVVNALGQIGPAAADAVPALDRVLQEPTPPPAAPAQLPGTAAIPAT
jgi:HEAT repeat protein